MGTSETHRKSAPSARLGILFTLALFVSTPLHAQELDELIRAHVEQLRDTGMLEVEGVPIAAKTMIPRIYEARSFVPAWRQPQQLDSLIESIESVHDEGLDPRDYHIDAVRAARRVFDESAALPAAERAGIDILLTDALVLLGYHLSFGKVDPVALDSNWNFSRELMGQDPVATLQAAIEARSIRDFAAEVIPRGFFYERLQAALADYRAIESAGGWATIASGPTLEAGMRDGRVAALARRLAVTSDYVPADEAGRGANASTGAEEASHAAFDRVEPLLYEGALVSAVQSFQTRHGLSADGAVGPATLAALNVPVAARIEQIRANLERARWVLGDLEEDFVIVNIAGFKLDVVRNEKPERTLRVQVGRPYRETPVFKSRLSYLVFNPTWTVPPTIFRRDILPEVRRNPAYLAGRNIDVLDNDGNRLDPLTIDWQGQRNFPYRLVQRPGPTNALGRVKFMFPNDHTVYLHDTPSRDLFDRDSRAFSSGCIRVDNPLELALELLGPKWDRARIDALLASGRTETVFLDDPLPVLLLYWTTEVDADGRVFFLPDVYERDAAVIGELNAPFSPASVL